MPFLIDGHNLIPHIRELNLSQLDDELALVEILEIYFRKTRKKAIVFFDRAAPGHDQNINRGFLSAHFTRPPLNADKAIRNEVTKLGRSAANYTVVSSDAEVQNHALRQGVQVLSSSEFAMKLTNSQKNINKHNTDLGDEMDYWLKIFENKP